jgi:hypothetical protein
LSTALKEEQRPNMHRIKILRRMNRPKKIKMGIFENFTMKKLILLMFTYFGIESIESNEESLIKNGSY